MECWTPGFPEEKVLEKFDTGNIALHLDGKSQSWEETFYYYPDADVIPFENDEKVLLLKPGETEVSLHVCD